MDRLGDEDDFFELIEDLCTDGNYRRTRFEQAERYQKRIKELEAQLSAQRKGQFVTIPVDRFERMRGAVIRDIRRELIRSKGQVLRFDVACGMAGYQLSDISPAKES